MFIPTIRADYALMPVVPLQHFEVMESHPLFSILQGQQMRRIVAACGMLLLWAFTVVWMTLVAYQTWKSLMSQNTPTEVEGCEESFEKGIILDLKMEVVLAAEESDGGQVDMCTEKGNLCSWFKFQRTGIECVD